MNWTPTYDVSSTYSRDPRYIQFLASHGSNFMKLTVSLLKKADINDESHE